MFIGSDNRNRAAFTLLEVTLAVAILAMMSLTIYRFVQSKIVAVRVSSEMSVSDRRYIALRPLLTMRLQAVSEKSYQLDLGFLRKPKDDAALTNANETWVRLIDNVQSLQIRYFDPRLNTWLDKWTDNIT